MNDATAATAAPITFASPESTLAVLDKAMPWLKSVMPHRKEFLRNSQWVEGHLADIRWGSLWFTVPSPDLWLPPFKIGHLIATELQDWKRLDEFGSTGNGKLSIPVHEVWTAAGLMHVCEDRGRTTGLGTTAVMAAFLTDRGRELVQYCFERFPVETLDKVKWFTVPLTEKRVSYLVKQPIPAEAWSKILPRMQASTAEAISKILKKRGVLAGAKT